MPARIADRGRLHPVLARTVVSVVTALFLTTGALHAQRLPASPPLPADHWAPAALERLAADGLLHGVWMPGTRPVPAAVAAAAFDSAVARAESAGSPLAAFADAGKARLAAELDPDGPGPIAWMGASAGVVEDDVPTAALDVRLQARPYRWAVAMVTPRLRVREGAGPSAGIETASVLAAVGPLQLGWTRAGRRLGSGAGGGLLLNDRVTLDAAVLGTAGPVRLPGFLAALGPVDLALSVTKIEAVTVDTTGTDPWMISGRLAVAPHPRLRFAVTRVITGVTEWYGETLDAGDVVNIVIGKHTIFDDQKASLEAALRLDPWGQPVSVYAELGFEDSAGIDEDPGLLAGLFLPRVAGLASTSLRWEFTAFGDVLCVTNGCIPSDRSWFLHPASRRLHMAPDGTPLGHPLGGYGWEHRAEVMVWPATSPVRATVTGTVRSREPDNLLYDDGATDYIGALALDWWPAPGWEGGARLEAGELTSLELRVALRGLGGR